MVLLRAARPGDIVLFKFDTAYWWCRPWAALIAWFQGDPTTHAAIVVDPALGVIVEAYWPRVRKAFIEDVLWDFCYEWSIVSPVGLTQEQRYLVTKRALGYVGRRYDIASLWQLAKWLLLEKLVGPFIRQRVDVHDSMSRFICSELVTQCHEDVGFRLAEKLGFADPAAVLPKDLTPKHKTFEVIESSYGWPTLDG